MTKSDLIEKLSQAEVITLKAAELAVNMVIERMSTALASGNRIEIRDFGSFALKDCDGYQGRNPMTGEPIAVKSKCLPRFRMGRELKRRLNGQNPLPT